MMEKIETKEIGLRNRKITENRYRKKIKVLKRTDQEKNLLRMKCRKLSQYFPDKEVIIDDESYFSFSNVDLTGNAGYYNSDSNQTPGCLKY